MIRPIEMQMLLPRTESVGNLQQNEIQHTLNTNANAAETVTKHEQKLSETVVKKEEKQYDTYQYDAKDESRSGYFSSGKKKKKNKSTSDATENENEESKDYQPRIDIQI